MVEQHQEPAAAAMFERIVQLSRPSGWSAPSAASQHPHLFLSSQTLRVVLHVVASLCASYEQAPMRPCCLQTRRVVGTIEAPAALGERCNAWVGCRLRLDTVTFCICCKPSMSRVTFVPTQPLCCPKGGSAFLEIIEDPSLEVEHAANLGG